MLIHREYSHAFPAKFVIEANRLYAENSNRPHGHGPIDPRLFSPYPKNPIIARVFKETGLADELGSGVRKLFKFGKAFAGHDPVLMEDDIFRVNLPISEVVGEETDAGLVDGLVEKAENHANTGKNTGKNTSVIAGPLTTQDQLAPTADLILALMAKTPQITVVSIANTLQLSTSTVEKQIAKLRKSGCLKRVGTRKSGYWEVLP